MFRFEPEEEILEAIFLGTILKVERFGSPIQVLTLTFTDGRTVTIAALADDLVVAEDNLPQC